MMVKTALNGVMVAAAVFLALRLVARVDVDPSLVVATFFGVAVAIFLSQTTGPRNKP